LNPSSTIFRSASSEVIRIFLQIAPFDLSSLALNPDEGVRFSF
jgi:hypothetical protein